MPMIDMPVRDLEHYKGTNPRPIDFDEYWADALKEMKAVDPQMITTKADFQTPVVECYHMFFYRSKRNQNSRKASQACAHYRKTPCHIAFSRLRR